MAVLSMVVGHDLWWFRCACGGIEVQKRPEHLPILRHVPCNPGATREELFSRITYTGEPTWMLEQVDG